MPDQPTTTSAAAWFVRAVAVYCFFVPSLPASATEKEERTASVGGYEFVCENDGVGLSIVDVLRATGQHGTFLDVLTRYDPDGFAILSDPELADKTVWAPTDAAFSEVDGSLSPLSDVEIKAVLGYHITPPRRTPEGPYPIITPQFLSEGGETVHQTRTGILTGSDQRVRTRAIDGVLTVQDSLILPTSWCTQTGSVFSIGTVIMDVAPPSPVERAIAFVFFENPLLSLAGLAAIAAAGIHYLRRRARKVEPSK